MQTQTGDDLMARILARPVDDQVRGQAANDLLNELFGGYPVESLRALLHSGDDDAVQTGAWLLSELGEQAAPLLEEVPALLAHQRLQVRFFAVEFVLLAADERHAGIIAQVLTLSRAADTAIRWKVLHFLAMASTEQLMAGLSRLDDPEVGRLTAGLVASDTEDPDPGEVVAGMEGDDPVARLFAAAIAVRMAEDDPALLAHAARVRDEEISSFAQWQLGRFQE
ncbi:hypothetical protein LDL08_21050 [Nonomuraea glycinis]|uniref:HEAT repeat domain-containing protein n=1 Tax=Nonomuraea glycinis TaxID=2047744 RepID=A0A918ABU6_9ACTN|nr:hypothetical protein [Nonomuraea glycinis]MCA2178681.1 hypothetical protein [Nonomuraea glycinis]GGP13759.1 hypothetical protein GCM10012278_66640 [Nonomuraea glycinis]